MTHGDTQVRQLCNAVAQGNLPVTDWASRSHPAPSAPTASWPRSERMDRPATACP
jgi:hypothetical protein